MSGRVEATLLGLGFRPTDLHTPVQHLSGGQKNMGALARVLLQEPDLLLLDEPSNHLDVTATEWLEGVFRSYRGTVVVISHDRYFLDRVVDEIVALEQHRLQRYVGNYSAYVTARAARLEPQRKAYELQQAEIRRQEEFIRRNMAGQNTKQAQSRQKALQHLGRFLFSGDEVLQTVGTLSGGEKSRVALAKLMLSTANLLVLDEPTNHLDIPAREVLEQALAAYPGTLLIVSHDRYFLDRIISRLLYMRDGTCTSYTGNYTDYQAHLAAQTAVQQQTSGVKKT